MIARLSPPSTQSTHKKKVTTEYVSSSLENAVFHTWEYWATYKLGDIKGFQLWGEQEQESTR